MRAHTPIAAALLTAALALCPLFLHAQNVHYGESFSLSDTLHPLKSHEYYADTYIDLKTGFHSEPKNHKHTWLELDPYGIHPPEAGLTGGPNASDTGVVGAIGGTVDVGLMGAAVYSIPIEVPAGINGMQPSLAITYNSHAGNGLLGWGWDLTGLSSIERTGRTRYHDGVIGAVTLNDLTDRYLLDGVRLIALADYSDSVEYKAEQDDMSRIMAYFRTEYVGGGLFGYGTIKVLDHFKIWKANGLAMEYGTTEDTWVDAQSDPYHALCWLLSRVSDRNGNAIVYHYDKSTSTGEVYISSIDYTEHTENGRTVVEPEFTMDFHYRPGYRGDYDFRYIAGNIVQSRKLLDHVSVNRNTGGSGVETERYSFSYRIDTVGQLYGSVKMHDRLELITLQKEGTSPNPTHIVWSSNGDGNVLAREPIGDTAIYKNFPFVGDFNGDGYSDLAVVPHMDSVYNHNVDVNFFMNNPDNPGHFAQSTALTLHNIDKRLDWIYPVDLNDDGLDDLAACFYDSIAATGRDTMVVKIYENLGGTRFALRDSITLGGGRFLVHQGDFLGRGGLQLLLMPLVTTPIQNPIAFSLLVWFDGDDLLKAPSLSVFPGVRDVASGDFDGDGGTDLLVVTDSCSTVYSLSLSGSNVSYNERFHTDEINHQGGWKHVFTGDFNGDGKTDLLYNYKEGYHSRWRLFYSTGLSLSAPETVNLSQYMLPPFNLYSNSLRKVMDGLAGRERRSSLNNSACIGDFDGDGIGDVAIISFNASTTSVSIYFHFNPSTHGFQSVFFGSNAPSPQYYLNCRTQYLHVGNFTGKENLSFLGLEYRNTSNTNNHPGVFSLKPASSLNSVKKVVDGLGNSVELGYGYVQQPYRDFNYGVRRMPVPVRVLTSVTTYNASDRQMREYLSFSDPLYHRDGHGWLGFKKRVRRTFEDGTEVGRSASCSSLETMTVHAMLLPEADTSYVFPGGDTVLAETVLYRFEKVLSSYGPLNTGRKVVCPALTEKVAVGYDPDNPGAVLTKTFTENHYNYANGLYYQTYHCDSTLTGVGGHAVTSLGGCEFLSKENTAFYYNDYATWTVNRPHVQTRTLSRTGKPDVTDSRWMEYPSIDSYLPNRVYDVPNGDPGQNPLMLRTDLEYYADGNLMRKTVDVPHGRLGEQQRTEEYEYDSGHRLATAETVSSGNLSYTTSYAYDGYDRLDTVTAPNGLATAYRSDPFGITAWTTNADGTQSCTAGRWSNGHPLAPNGAMYYTWTRSSDGTQSLVFYHKTGAELRSVGYGLHGEPILTDRQYDGRGRLSAVSSPYKEGETPRWTAYGYDSLDRLSSITTPDSTVTGIVHDGFVTETTVTPPSGTPRTSSVTVNAMGWTVRSDDASGSYVAYDHYADGLLASATVNGDPATTVTATYDHARRRDTVTDPNYGTLATVYDAYGRLRISASPREEEAHTQTTTVYDGLDRVATMTDGLEGTLTQYAYNEDGVEKGTLDGILFRKQGGAEIQRIGYEYDTLARLASTTERRGAVDRKTAVEYDSQSRVRSVVHPSGVTVSYGYHRGYLMDVTDGGGNLLWRTGGMDAQGRLLEARLGNGAVTRHAYDTVMHRLENIFTTKNLQNLTYSYDKFGNLATRKDNRTRMEERFEYDDMDRLTGITLKRPSGQDLHCAVTYDALGRMTSRQAVTAANGMPQVTTVFSDAVFNTTAKPHAMDAAATVAGVFPADAQAVTYTGFDKVGKVKQGTDSICYAYGYDRQRILMEEHVGTNARTKQYWGDCEYVTESDGNTTSSCWRTFIMGPHGVFAVVESRNGMDGTHYVLKDNLGSWTAITDESGNLEQRLSYDAWGNLRNPNTWANYTSGDTYDGPLFDRGFTGHEHLTAFGLVNMNGRMYDPVVSSFLSPDRFVQNPLTATGFNRYAYCLHNPLRFIDPSGWLAGPGGGNDGRLPIVIINGVVNHVLPEVSVIDDNPSLSNTKEKITYNTYYYGGARVTLPWSDSSNGQSIGPTNSGGSGGGSGNHGGNTVQNNMGEIPPEGAIIHSGCFLLMKAYWHYQFGRKEDFWVDASTLKLDYITQKDLSYHDGIATVNLFDHSKTAQSALTLGKIDLTPVGDNLFEIHYDTYNFEIEWDYGWTTRNIGTAISGYIHGPVFDDVPLPTHWMDGKPCYAQPSVYWGGTFKIRFTNCVYIKP